MRAALDESNWSDDAAVTAQSNEIGTDVLDACRRGERDGFRALYDAYRDRVYSIALRFFHGDGATAADVTQDVFIKLMSNIGSFRGDAGFSTWLHRLVVNACLDRSRAAQAREVATLPDALDAVAIEPTHEHEIARRETASSVRQAVSSLPAKLRLAILLRYFDDLSYEEMAAAMRCSPGTVASRLSRGHRLLAARLAALTGQPVRPRS